MIDGFSDFRESTVSVLLLVTEKTTHVDVLLDLLLLFFLFFFGGSRGSWTGSSGSSTWGGAGNVGEEITDVGGLQSLGEEHGPVWLDGVSGGLDNLVQLLSL